MMQLKRKFGHIALLGTALGAFATIYWMDPHTSSQRSFRDPADAPVFSLVKIPKALDPFLTLGHPKLMREINFLWMASTNGAFRDFGKITPDQKDLIMVLMEKGYDSGPIYFIGCATLYFLYPEACERMSEIANRVVPFEWRVDFMLAVDAYFRRQDYKQAFRHAALTSKKPSRSRLAEKLLAVILEEKNLSDGDLENMEKEFPWLSLDVIREKIRAHQEETQDE